MRVLVLNSGSSSLKFQLVDTDPERMANDQDLVLAEGLVEKIGTADSVVRYSNNRGEKLREEMPILEHGVAVEKLIHLLTHPEHGVIAAVNDIEAVGHRIVHGGEKFSASALITPEILENIRECVELAPLHNPPNILGYEVAVQALPKTPHVAVFDTAFHQTMPDYAYMYALPYALYKQFQVRRYGFHGSSHRYVASRLEKLTTTPLEEMNVITVHIGNGCSMAAIRKGKTIDTSMGMTPLEGLVMGTRAGDIDPAIILFLMEKEGLEIDQANALLNKHSGLLGLSGISNDMRELEAAVEKGEERAILAINVFCYRIRKYIGAYAAALGGVDHIAFTAGIGENSCLIRKKSCEGLEFLGLQFDDGRNAQFNRGEGLLTMENSRVKAWVVPTNEERVIARDTMICVLNNA